MGSECFFVCTYTVICVPHQLQYQAADSSCIRNVLTIPLECYGVGLRALLSYIALLVFASLSTRAVQDTNPDDPSGAYDTHLDTRIGEPVLARKKKMQIMRIKRTGSRKKRGVWIKATARARRREIVMGSMLNS